MEVDIEEQLSDLHSSIGNRNNGNSKMSRFIDLKFAGMHFVYGFCDGTSIIELRKYQH
jgi:hypothetical protein